MTTPRKRIFVIGTGRSGTCWMGELLNTHAQIHGFVEPKPVFDLVTSAALEVSQSPSRLDPIFVEYDRLFEKTDPFHFADKTHPALWIAEHLAARYEHGYFIGMLRNVEPTVASMLRHSGVRRWCEQWDQFPLPNRFLGISDMNRDWYARASIAERCTARWWAHRNGLRRLVPILGDRLLIQEYELLVTAARRELARIQVFLRLTDGFPTPAVHAQPLSKWKDQLSAREVGSIYRAVAYLDSTVYSR